MDSNSAWRSRALAMIPALLLADEPTGNLDLLAVRCDRTIDVVDGRIVARLDGASAPDGTVISRPS